MTIPNQIRQRLDELTKQRTSLDEEERRLKAALEALDGKPAPATSSITLS